MLNTFYYFHIDCLTMLFDCEKLLGGTNQIGQQKGGGNMPSNEECGIRDVWGYNLEEEFRTIRQVVQQYQYIAMDTKFPGVVARPIGKNAHFCRNSIRTVQYVTGDMCKL